MLSHVQLRGVACPELALRQGQERFIGGDHVLRQRQLAAQGGVLYRGRHDVGGQRDEGRRQFEPLRIGLRLQGLDLAPVAAEHVGYEADRQLRRVECVGDGRIERRCPAGACGRSLSRADDRAVTLDAGRVAPEIAGNLRAGRRVARLHGGEECPSLRGDVLLADSQGGARRFDRRVGCEGALDQAVQFGRPEQRPPVRFDVLLDDEALRGPECPRRGCRLGR